jgi:FkbM family methyltransferase
MIKPIRLSTKSKILVARILYKIVTLFVGEGKRTVQRQKINYEVDLSEGIELSLFLFGSFQRHITNSRFLNLKADDIIMDVGANVGLMSLQFAAKVPFGRVYSFEPTHYAFEKLKRNLSLNPELACRIFPHQVFVSEKSATNCSMVAYSSWKVDGTKTENDHTIHFGTPKDTTGIPTISLDEFMLKNHISKIKLLKIDTDGFEYEVLKGAEKLIVNFRPIIILEISLYTLQDKGISFDFIYDYFNHLGYRLFDLVTNAEVNVMNFRQFIPENGSADLIAIP